MLRGRSGKISWYYRRGDGWHEVQGNMAKIKGEPGRTLILIVDYERPPLEIDHSLFYSVVKALAGDTSTVGS